MPFLHRELYPAGASGLLFWPGLPEPPTGCHIPENFPFSPSEAARLLDDMRHFAKAGIPAHAWLVENKEARRVLRLHEKEDITAFADGVTARSYGEICLAEAEIAAQSQLLRARLLEECRLEILRLEQCCEQISEQFESALGVETEEEDAKTLLLTRRTQSLVASSLPSSRMLLENICLFLPEMSELVFMHEAEIAELREAGIAPASEADSADGKNIAPLWQALGMSGPRSERPWLERIFRFAVRRNT